MNICPKRLKEIIIDAEQNPNKCPFDVVQGDCGETISFIGGVKSNAFILNVFQNISDELRIKSSPVVPFKDVITKRHGQNTPHRFEKDSCEHCGDNIRAIVRSVKSVIQRSSGCDLSKLEIVGEDKKG